MGIAINAAKRWLDMGVKSIGLAIAIGLVGSKRTVFAVDQSISGALTFFEIPSTRSAVGSIPMLGLNHGYACG